MAPYIHSGAKNRRSGSSMQQCPARGELSRRAYARLVYPGYPWDGRFTTEAEIESYLDADALTCLLCGKSYASLATHLTRGHNVWTDDYKNQFGITQKTPLVGKSIRAGRAAVAASIDLGGSGAARLKGNVLERGPARYSPPEWVKEKRASALREYFARRPRGGAS